MASVVASIITVESSFATADCADQRPHLHGFENRSSIELDDFPNNSQPSIRSDVEAAPVIAGHETERSETGNQGPTSEQIQTLWNPYKNRFRVMATCTTAFGNGTNDAAAGALIASLEKHYSIGYGTVSLIFVCTALGFITAAFFINTMSKELGRAKSLFIAEAILVAGYISIVTTPPFPVVAMSFFVLGVGMAINLAIGQVFCSNLANNTAILGAFQGCYGIGGISGPLIATVLVSRGFLWSRFYLIELALAVINLIFCTWAFWNYENETENEESEREAVQARGPDTSSFEFFIKSNLKSFKTLVSHTPTILGACFIFAYQGAEVAISGWIISFLVQIRNGDPSKVGYVTSGFWGGITLGRFTLSFLAHRMGERRFVFIATVGALILELLIWFVPSIPGNSVVVAFSGLLLGPIYPCAVHLFERLIPRKMQISSLSLIGSVGTSGGAVAPFMTGIIAQSAGTFVLHPICIGLFICMIGFWWSLPGLKRRDT